MPASLEADQNQSPRDLVVMKFGGTSVEDTVAIRRLVQIVHSRTGFRLVVVVSALAKVTDQLLSAAQAAAEGKLDYSTALVTHIRLRHQEIAGELLDSEDYAALHREFDAEFRLLNSALCEVAVARELTPCAQDAVSRFGERFSSKLVAAVLCEHRVDAVHYDAATAIVTDSRHSCATPLWERSYENLSQALQPLLQSARVPVLGGFIASTADGVPSTLGRGGSDLTASLVGAALGAQRVEIWTDVDGIMTTDPNVCPDARRIPQMSFDHAAELAHAGAKVLHHATLLPAMRANIPVHVLNSRNPECAGTEILGRVEVAGSVRALTAKRGVASVAIESRDAVSADLLNHVCAAFDRHSCPIDLVSASAGRLSLLVGSTAALPMVASELRGIANVTWENHKALVSLVGDNLRRQPNVASRAFDAVADLDPSVLCQGTSDRTLTFLVDEDKAAESVRRLHAVFFSERKPPVPSSFNMSALCQAGESWL
jgi:aspartate kinase